MIPTLAYNALNRSVRVCSTRAGAAVWGRLWDHAWRHWSGTVTTELHGRRVTVNAGYPYPMLMRRWPTYNDPLVEVVHQAAIARGHAVTVVDVGGAVGDTALLLLDRAGDAVSQVWCVEGDEEFFALLRQNVAGLDRVRTWRALLSDGEGPEASLERIHRGTASAQGTAQTAATTMDSLLGGEVGSIGVVKVDTDGFDGKVLAGAAALLDRDRPAVIFEWHPKLYVATGNDWMRPLRSLASHDYDRFVWFTKFGELSHIAHGVDAGSVEELARVCLDDAGPALDWHYDVVALHSTSPISASDLAALRIARARRGGRPRP
jgi:FkbM family methyltransferase